MEFDLEEEKGLIKTMEGMTTDQAVDTLKHYGYKRSDGKIVAFFKGFAERHPDFIKRIADNIKKERTCLTDEE